MIKTVLIDDERIALRMLEHLLKESPMIEISGMFTDPLDAICKIIKIKPQIVFLDINMPQLQGIDAASRILDLCPETDIIFVTAYEQYAVEAFELYALDYILKPVSRKRLEKTLQRVMKKNKINRIRPGKRLKIKCFGSFQMGWLGKEPVKWRTEKTKELFAFLLHHEGRVISKDNFLDQLWPEIEVKKAVHQLYNGVYYIRKTLKEYGVESSLINIFGSYGMKIGVVDLDVQLFREGFKKVKNKPVIEDLEALEKLYTGEYMEGTDWPWAEFEHWRFSRQYDQVVVALSQAYIEKNEFGRAEELLLKAFNRNPYEERFTELLLKLYNMTGDKAEAVRHFMEYARILKQELGIEPRQNIYKTYAIIK